MLSGNADQDRFQINLKISDAFQRTDFRSAGRLEKLRTFSLFLILSKDFGTQVRWECYRLPSLGVNSCNPGHPFCSDIQTHQSGKLIGGCRFQSGLLLMLY
ncbi:hypothetical protein NPIL_294251 [Nephila pilipes]|uniref:Uncharacterized protein n=1 Tax=Nephila pilipes TaxID=299642 RepID=A0A8X6MNV6_NEPPI|nr:hypothetical protein NPIL_294251 [Nephila pilipes]